jgi:hypothetical protein
MTGPHTCLIALLVLSTLAACQSNPNPAPNTTARLTVVLNGPKTANIRIEQAGSTVFNGKVTGTQTVRDLPRALLKVSAETNPEFDPPAAQSVDLSNGDQTLALNFGNGPFVIKLDTPTVTVHQEKQVSVSATISAKPGFSGSVNVRAENLPAGVRQLETLNVTLGPNPVTVLFHLAVSKGNLPANTDVDVIASTSDRRSQTTLELRTRPLIFPLNPFEGIVVGADGNAYYLTLDQPGVAQITPGYVRTQVITQALPGTERLVPSPDGNLWFGEREPKRIVLASKQIESYPKRLSNTGGFAFRPANNKTGWYGYAGLWQVDLSSGTDTLVPGTDTLTGPYLFGLGQIDGDTYWVIAANGVKSLLEVNANTRATIEHPLVHAAEGVTFLVQNRQVYVTDQGKLYRQHLETGMVEVVGVSGMAKVTSILGQDPQGNIWLANDDQWVHFDPRSGTVLRIWPAMADSYQTTVNADGGLWISLYAGVVYVQP